MAEIKYQTVREWLDKAKALRLAGQEPKSADDPRRRALGFSDKDEHWHYVTLSEVMRAKHDGTLSEEEGTLLPEIEGRKTLIEVGLPDPPPEV